MNVMLPGGVEIDGRLERRATFRSLTGVLEQQFAHIVQTAENTPRTVTLLLDAAVSSYGDTPAAGHAARMCFGDRKFLLVRLAQQLYGDCLWLEETCERCTGTFDLDIRRSALPVTEAGAGFPYAHATIGADEVVLRVPTGADQEAIVDMDEFTATRTLIGRTVVSVDGTPPLPEFLDRLEDADVAQMESALDAIAPDIGTSASVRCPECDADQYVHIDVLPDLPANALYENVHTLAVYYHWTEHDILALPRARRRFYLDQIDRARGVHA